MAKKKKSSEVQTMPSIDNSDDWKVKDALETLIRSQEICQDEELMKKVKKLAKVKKRAITSVDDLIEYRNDKYGYKSEQDEEDDD